ncbi:MAG TPA: leucyl aminopeptidase family protein [Mycobacteriales bacterium]|nr:leucyl aminopeptidase family protein [Mycobacteriales bacterium]
MSIATGASQRAAGRFVPALGAIDDADALVVLASASDGRATLLATTAAPDELRREIEDALELVGFTGKPGQVARLPRMSTGGPRSVTVAAVRPDAEEAEILGAISTAVRATAGARRVVVDAAADPEAALLRAVLATYRFTVYQPAADAVTEQVALVSGSAADAARIEDLIAAICFARDLVTFPPADKTPARVAELLEAAAAEVGAECRVYDEDEIAELGMGGLLAVSRASVHPPRLVRIHAPGTEQSVVGVVGKGLTYDAGGLNLKLAMLECMKLDVGGAAAAAAAALHAAKYPRRNGITAWLPLCENVTSGSAYRGGDVLRMRSGLTVEVQNTDAEGRLVLADAMSLAAEENPVAMLTIATLTGAALRSLGFRTAALMSPDETFAADVLAAAAAGREDVWRMPMRRHFAKTLESKIADINNLGDQNHAQTMVAASFLHRFAPDGVPFAHFDIAGPAYNHGEPYEHVPPAGTGFGVTTLVELLDRR